MTSDFSSKLPHIPDEHVTGRRAVEVFRFRKKKDWVANEVQYDYGWDIIVTIREDKYAKEDFYIQMKGHNKPAYSVGIEFLSETLEVSTIRWLLQKTVPSMLCVCDTGQRDEPIYYVWIEEAVETIQNSTPDWENQETITLRVPVSNLLDESSHSVIEEYVKEYFTKLRINETIGQIIFPNEQFTKETLKAAQSKPGDFVVKNIAPSLAEAGLIDVVEDNEEIVMRSLTEDERELFKKLTEVSFFLKAFNDQEASRVLASLPAAIESSADTIKAKYYNCKSTLALHLGNAKDALLWIEKAYSLRPLDPKIATNYVLVQFHFLKTATGKAKKPQDLITILDKIIDSKPTFWSAIRLKAYLLSDILPIEKVFNWDRVNSLV
jgi:tetratricopeptide (TPR) repeat protein